MKIKAVVEKELELPSVPNFIRTTQNDVIAIEDLEDEVLRGLGRLWTDELVKKAREKRKSL